MSDNYGGKPVSSRVRGGREAILVLGICSVALGVLVPLWPGKTVPTLELLLGLYLAVSAGAQVFLAFGARFAMPLRALLLVSGLLSVILAVLALSGGNSIPTLSMWLGLGWAMRGVSQATVAVWDEQLSEPLRLELAGVAALVIGIVVLLWPLESTMALGFVAAAGLLAIGAAELGVAGVGRAEARAVWANRIAVPCG
ncbi:DUF308 domain-containing protein [Nocardia farcinica]|uniref:DUF308 domain-containing protein n=1 Tax=Nocardia farcinica TaxID=37329 RepID=UPI00189394A6|nr:DUF308 domain-containing protein [Nocardia farcinica]MBF6523835.1 DUF308 domain-containing protein [Nocardia farcinica]